MVSMGLKKKGNKSSADKPQNRSKGISRARLVIQIVATDSTFELVVTRDLSPTWIGKCIHCNRKLAVLSDGQTSATVEHIVPLCAGGSGEDLRNLALACKKCNNWKGVDHDAKNLSERAQEVVTALGNKRLARWREPVTA
jgi:5-methylcytosine-specific restriction endonuclease McrA